MRAFQLKKSFFSSANIFLEIERNENSILFTKENELSKNKLVSRSNIYNNCKKNEIK